MRSRQSLRASKLAHKRLLAPDDPGGSAGCTSARPPAPCQLSIGRLHRPDRPWPGPELHVRQAKRLPWRV